MQKVENPINDIMIRYEGIEVDLFENVDLDTNQITEKFLKFTILQDQDAKIKVVDYKKKKISVLLTKKWYYIDKSIIDSNMDKFEFYYPEKVSYRPSTNSKYIHTTKKNIEVILDIIEKNNIVPHLYSRCLFKTDASSFIHSERVPRIRCNGETALLPSQEDFENLFKVPEQQTTISKIQPEVEVRHMGGDRVDGYYYLRLKDTNFVLCRGGHADSPHKFSENDSGRKNAELEAEKINKQLREMYG